jgi:hypothetical protein
VQGLIRMFDESNELIKYFRTGKNKFGDNTLRTLNLTILDCEDNREKQYEQPTCNEIVGLVVCDIGLHNSNKDIVAEMHHRGLQRISKFHPKFMSFQYLILFPFGQDGYRIDLKMLHPKGN